MKRKICALIVVFFISVMIVSCSDKYVSVNGGEGFTGKFSFMDESIAFDGMYVGMKQKDVKNILKNKGYNFYLHELDPSMKYARHIYVARSENAEYEYLINMYFDEESYRLSRMEVQWEIDLSDGKFPGREEKAAQYKAIFQEVLGDFSGSFGEELFSNGEKTGYAVQYTYIFDSEGNVPESVSPDDDGWESFCETAGSYLTITGNADEYTPVYLGDGKYLEKSGPYPFKSDDEYISFNIGKADYFLEGYEIHYEFNSKN